MTVDTTVPITLPMYILSPSTRPVRTGKFQGSREELAGFEPDLVLDSVAGLALQARARAGSSGRSREG